ncbi:MAG: hypothetical protein GX580_03930 [Candidatus Hydrogenedens sp.]|nr:hypothetical protein [Candidatus Hydrogenedentota bacterium]NLF56768.1 hypothetical protein [Candidatus Hydrogenedens sp.]
MLTALVFLAASLSAGEWDARLATLSFQVDRLEAVTVAEGLESEKAGRVAALRELLAKGADSTESFNALYMEIDAARTWLLANSREKPALAAGNFGETDAAWRIITPDLDFLWHRDSLAMEITAGGHTWRFEGGAPNDIEREGKKFSLTDARVKSAAPLFTGYGAGMILALSDFEAAPGLALHCTVQCVGKEIVFDLAAGRDADTVSLVRWPKAVITEKTPDNLAVIPRMQGMLVPGDWPQRIYDADLCQSRGFYMPWWGQIQNGHGVQAILETDMDAGGEYEHPKGGPTRIAPRWYPTLGRLGYLRSIRYVFSDDATYVTMAKRYRRYVQEKGNFVSLKEKLAATPALNDVIGQPVIHLGALYHFVPSAQLFNKDRIENNHAMNTFDQLREGLEELKARGLDKAYVHLDGWGFYGYDNGHPDVMPVGEEQGGAEGMRRLADKCAEMDYLFAVHDQYRDFYLNAAAFDDRLTVTRLDGSREEHSVWCGGPQTILSPRFAPEYVRRNHDWFAANGINVRGAYLDVFAVVPVEESAQAAHPVTRAECAEYRRDCFDILKARGYVVSSEEPADYLVRTLHLVHHGPYATYPNIGGGGPCGIPVPLFSLVYHDSILLPWDMGDDGGWGIPKGDPGRLHCLLNAGLPYIDTGADEKAVALTKEAADLAKRCAFAEMTDHKFLDKSWRKQESAFSDGTRVVVDFDKKTAEIIPAP